MRVLSRLPVGPVLTHQSGRCSHPGADCRALAGIATDGAADGAERGASGTTPERSALLRRWRRGLHRLRRIDPGLALRPVVALELVLLELVLALPLLRIHEHLGTHGAGEHQQCQRRADDRHSRRHRSPPSEHRQRADHGQRASGTSFASSALITASSLLSIWKNRATCFGGITFSKRGTNFVFTSLRARSMLRYSASILLAASSVSLS